MDPVNTTDEIIPLVPPAEVDRLRVLIVDDDPIDRTSVRRSLMQAGLEIAADEAGSAAEALHLIERASPDCILLDYYLPDMPGSAILGELRAVAPDVPVLIFTGWGDEDLAVELMKAGAADYLPKGSITPERLRAGVRHAIELARADRARREAEDRLRTEESRFRTLVDAIPQLAWMADPSGSHYWFNQRWLDYTGTTTEQMRGWNWRHVVHPDYVEEVDALFQRSCATGWPFEKTYPLRGRDGSYRWFLTRAVPIREANGTISGWLGTSTDVTEQKNAEAERERLLALEQEARVRAERATRARDDLLAIVAHDLRNPLQVIAGAAARLSATATDPVSSHYVEFVRRAARDMDRLVCDLLDLSSMESGTFAVQLKPVDIGEALNAVREQFDLSAQQKGIAFECDIAPDTGMVNGDRDRLLQVVANLLGNAMKFAPQGGTVSLHVSRRRDHAEITVRDNGPGIAPDQMPHIFDRFWRGDRGTRSGAGLGLAICKGIIEAHNGSIRVNSAPGSGTMVEISIPLARNGSASIAIEAAANGAERPDGDSFRRPS